MREQSAVCFFFGWFFIWNSMDFPENVFCFKNIFAVFFFFKLNVKLNVELLRFFLFFTRFSFLLSNLPLLVEFIQLSLYCKIFIKCWIGALEHSKFIVYYAKYLQTAYVRLWLSSINSEIDLKMVNWIGLIVNYKL